MRTLQDFPNWISVDGGTLVLSCSGGIDSVVLAHAAISTVSTLTKDNYWKKSAPQIVLWHLRHGIRQDDGLDAVFVQELANQWGVRAVIEGANVLAARRPGIDSIESTARRIRYDSLLAFLHNKANCIAFTAHHADDNAETILFNLLRGTGPAGLRGISPVYLQKIHRPLLPVTSQQISQYANDNGLVWREDSSNLDTGFRRNYIRHEIMPRLLKVNQASVSHINRLAHIADDLMHSTPQTTFDFKLIEGEELIQRLPLLTRPSSEFGLVKFMPEHLEQLFGMTIAGALRRIGCRVNYDLISELHWGLMGKRYAYSDGDWHFRFPGKSLMAYCRESDEEVSIDDQQAKTEVTPIQLDARARIDLITNLARSNSILGTWWDWLDDEDFDSEQDPDWMAVLPAAGVDAYSFRTRRPADRITLPNGATRKVGDVFTDQKVPEFLRDCWAMLVDQEDRVVWIPAVADSRTMHELNPQDSYVIAAIRPLE